MARKIEDLVGRLASGDTTRHGPAVEELLAMDSVVLGPLLQASRILAPAAASRCRAARERYVETKGLWLCDEPSGAGPQALDEGQRRFLEKPLDFRARNEGLEDLLKNAGIRATLKAKHDRPLHLWAKGLRTQSALKAVTRPYGLDFYLDGESIVIDTAANVRAAVTK